MPKPISNQDIDIPHLYSESFTKTPPLSPSNLKPPTVINSGHPNYEPNNNIRFPYQEGFLEPLHRRPSKQYLYLPSTLADQIDHVKLIYKFLPKQSDIDQPLKQINKKVLKQLQFTSQALGHTCNIPIKEARSHISKIYAHRYFTLQDYQRSQWGIYLTSLHPYFLS